MRHPDTVLLTLAVSLTLGLLLLSCDKTATPKQEADASDQTVPDATPSGPLVTCPVCGLQFHQSEHAATATYNGKTYYFFLVDHQKAFKLSPETYLKNDI